MIEDLKIGILIPTRGIERLDFVKNALRLVSLQTFRPFKVEVVGDEPLNDLCDITFRYRTGYERFKDCDMVFYWEDDDWYAPDYLEYMIKEWDKVGRPDLFGTRYTIYYHLKLKRYFTMHHEQRASMMNTMMRTNLKINWGLDHNPYTDAQIWDCQPVRKKLFTPNHIIAVGMKHGVGMPGGKGHIDNFARYLNDDKDMYWLRKLVDEDSFAFYEEMNKKLA